MTLFAISIPMVLYYCYGYAVPIVILAVLFGFRWKVGFWGNAVSLGTVLFSILVAVGWWEDLAQLIAKQLPAILFFADCIAIWLIFLVTLLLLDFAARGMSQVKVKYADMVEKIGNGLALFLLFITLYGFYLFAEELGPVGERVDANTPGDSVAVQVFRILSAGNLSGFTKTQQFDDQEKFRELHMKRRQAIMSNVLNKDEDDGVISALKGTEEQVNKMKRGTE